jgi:hypothetical protein
MLKLIFGSRVDKQSFVNTCHRFCVTDRREELNSRRLSLRKRERRINSWNVCAEQRIVLSNVDFTSRYSVNLCQVTTKNYTKLHGLSLRRNYTDLATAACQLVPICG